MMYNVFNWQRLAWKSDRSHCAEWCTSASLMSSVWGQWHLTVVQKSQSLSSSKLSTNVSIIVKNEKNKNQPITVCFFISHFSSFVYDHFIFWNGHCMRSLSSHLSSTFSAVHSTKSLTSLSLSFALTLLHTQPHTITIQWCTQTPCPTLTISSN